MQSFPHSDIIQALVQEDPKSGLPRHTFVSETTCIEYADLLGVLMGHKTCAILRTEFITSKRRPPVGMRCGETRIQGDPEEWAQKVWAECGRKNIMAFKVPKKPAMSILFRKGDERAAAAVHVLEYTDAALGFPLAAFVVGKLLGYRYEDVRAYYFAQALDNLALGMDDGWYEREPVDPGTRAKFISAYTKFQADGARALKSVMESDEIAAAAKQLVVNPVQSGGRRKLRR